MPVINNFITCTFAYLPAICHSLSGNSQAHNFSNHLDSSADIHLLLFVSGNIQTCHRNLMKPKKQINLFMDGIHHSQYFTFFTCTLCNLTRPISVHPTYSTVLSYCLKNHMCKSSIRLDFGLYRGMATKYATPALNNLH